MEGGREGEGGEGRRKRGGRKEEEEGGKKQETIRKLLLEQRLTPYKLINELGFKKSTVYKVCHELKREREKLEPIPITSCKNQNWNIDVILDKADKVYKRGERIHAKIRFTNTSMHYDIYLSRIFVLPIFKQPLCLVRMTNSSSSSSNSSSSNSSSNNSNDICYAIHAGRLAKAMLSSPSPPSSSSLTVDCLIPIPEDILIINKEEGVKGYLEIGAELAYLPSFFPSSSHSSPPAYFPFYIIEWNTPPFSVALYVIE